MLNTRLTLAAGLAVLASSSFAGTFTDNFNSGLNSANWTVTQTTPGRYSYDTSSGNVHLFKGATANSGAVENIVVNLNMASIGGPVAGDFSEQIDFSNAVMSTTGTTQVELHSTFADSSFFFDVYDNGGGLNFHVWDGAGHGTQGTTLNGATFKIARVGGVLSGYYNNNLIYSSAGSTANLTAVSFVLQTQPNEGGSAQSVNFDNFSLTGASVVPEPFTVIGLAAGVLALARKRRRSA